MIQTEIYQRVGYIILNRPEKRNALNSQMVQDITEAMKEMEKDENCKVVVFKANGEAFCAGADLAYLQQLQNFSYEQNLEDSKQLMSLFSYVHHYPKITISQVEGTALAGGCGLATLADFCFATPSSTFGYTEVKIGFIPAIVSVFLTQKIGENLAKSLLLTGKIISAVEAAQMHLISSVIDDNKIQDEVSNFAQKLSAQVSGDSILLTKELLNNLAGKSLNEQLLLAAQYNAKARATNDCKKGIAAFLNKEKLSW